MGAGLVVAVAKVDDHTLCVGWFSSLDLDGGTKPGPHPPVNRRVKMATCAKCGSSKLTEQPCPKCGSLANRKQKP